MVQIERDNALKIVPKLVTARKVHVLDDDPSFCMILEGMLNELGYDVTTHTEAKLEVLREMSEPDLLFIDMMMPGTNGLQVLNYLANNQIKSSVVLMGSAADVLGTAQALAELKGLALIGILRKPFTEDQLINVLQKS